MIIVGLIFALLGSVVHLLAFCWETILFSRPGVHQGVFSIPTADTRPVRLWAFNVGCYNLFLACGPIAGVTTWALGNQEAGRALIIYCCLFMFLAGIALFVSDRLALSRPRGKGVGGAMAQSVPPLIALAALVIADL